MRGERAVLLLIAFAFITSVSVSIAKAAPFENDEAVYATQARAWAASGPTTGILPHRAPLLPAIGTVLYRLGARAEWAYRLIGLVSGLAVLVLVWLLARDIAGPATGAIAAAVFASSPPFLLRSAQFMTDVPATAFLLATTLILWRNRERPTWTLLLAALFAAGAFYARYASILPIGMLAVGAVVMWHRALRSRPVVVGMTILAFVVLLVPHIVHAIDVTGRPWGLITFTASYASQAHFGQGLRDYIFWLPFALAGPLAGIVMIGGIVTAIRHRSPVALFLVVIAIADILVIGATDHAEARFVFFPVALLCIAGATAAARVRPVSIPAIAATVALVGAGAFVVARTDGLRTAREAPRAVGRVVASLAGRPCTVLAVDVGPTTWYTGCSTYYFNDPATARADVMVIYQAGGAALSAQPDTLPLPPGQPIEIRDNGRELATIYPVIGR